MTDVRIAHHGSLSMVRPLTDAARQWIDDNVGGETSWFGGALAVEPRYLDNLIDGMESDGLVVA